MSDEFFQVFSDHVISLIRTPENVKSRLHPYFNHDCTCECVNNEYAINQAYHDHIERHMTAEELKLKRDQEHKEWAVIEKKIIQDMEIDAKRYPITAYLGRCYTPSMTTLVWTEYESQLSSLKRSCPNYGCYLT